MKPFVKRLLEKAKQYIIAHPELADKIFTILIGYLFPEESLFSADENTPEPLKAFAAECDVIVAEDAEGGS